MKTNYILGLNARAQLFTFRNNTREGKKIAKSKILTARYLKRIGVKTPKIYKKFFKPQAILEFDWHTLPKSFVIKPSKGLGGGGIVVIKRRSKDGKYWTTATREKLSVEDIKLHVLDILEGAYSTGSVPDSVIIQEYVGRHKAFARVAYRGTPDIRIIVFNKVPVMAMLRLPTQESGGRANLHQGAVGVGIDMASGVTTKAIWHGNPVKFKPQSTIKLSNIKVPQWNKILDTATRCSDIPGLGYMGVDIVLHPERGPLVLEVNSQPGLQIQLANGSGLKKRLERVEDLDVVDFEQGVRISKALFREKLTKNKFDDGPITIKASEEVYIKNKKGFKVKTLAKIDTGAWSSSLDIKLARKLGIYSKKRILWYTKKISSLGEEERPVIATTFWLGGKKVTTTMTVSDREKLTYPVILGRTDLDGFLVDPKIEASLKNKA